ncbi:putative hexokinase [Talaromyces proteolyticus]|uniref:hexokinase n=1 Tax=Talaromyces proteolyticus TaxID=1131652 RepID=A0AAD4PYG0_9EURO|nr:putative hexokinase [Talaromyces proteolyticus]KAH8695128.1 putative hexokinase [Talaromyces proteolyticus]
MAAYSHLPGLQRYADLSGSASVASSSGPPKTFGNKDLVGVPAGLLYELRVLGDMFVVTRSELKSITQQFLLELDKGLTKEGGNIKGTYITIDMGGTKSRVYQVELTVGKGKYELLQQKFCMPDGLRLKSKNSSDHGLALGRILPLSFTFSFPVTQWNIRSGILQRWTKDFDVARVEGEDVVPQLEAALAKRNVPVRIIAIVNDTTGTLMASRYKDPAIRTGTEAIPKIKGADIVPDLQVAINTEYGAFNNDRKVSPRTKFDRAIDEASPRPGQQLYEKMVAGLYIGEILRLILLDLYGQNNLFRGHDTSLLRQKHSIDALFLSTIEKDKSKALHEISFIFNKALVIKPAVHELKVAQYLTELFATRSARLYLCGIAAISMRCGLNACHVGVDGSMFDWLDDLRDPITLHSADDGSAVGAALIVALVLETSKETGMRFRSELANIPVFAKLTSSLTSLGKICWLRLESDTVRFTIIPDQGTQVWAALPADSIFDETYTLESAVGVINLEVPIGSLSRALRSAVGSKSAQLRLTRKGRTPLLALTIVTSSWKPTNAPLGVDANEISAIDDEAQTGEGLMRPPRVGGRDRETVITQEIPIRLLHQSAVDGLHEPHCREPDIHIILPSLAQLKAISDRFTKLAVSNSNINGNLASSSSAFGPKLELSANMHGSLKLGIATDSLRISSVWTGLVNPALDPNQLSDTDISELPSERMRRLGAESNGDDEAGWAKVRIDGKDWGRVLSVGRLSPKVVACFIHETALILYVYLRGGFSGEESCLTYYINSYAA